jgi:hypothetical protein
MRGSVQGYVVRTGNGQPLAGVTVEGAPAGPPRAAADVPVAAPTDEAGLFRFDELPRGGWTLLVRAASGQLLGQDTVQVFDDAVSAVTIEVAAPGGGGRSRRAPRTGRPMQGSIRGRVVRTTNGEPVADAAITVVRGAGAAPDLAPLSDGAGGFVLGGLPAGEWRLAALGPGGESGEATARVVGGGVAEVEIFVDLAGGAGTPEGGVT